jgi:Phage integrase family
MIRADLAKTRQAWIEDTRTSREQRDREQSCFLAYRDEGGRKADFHTLRHTFISNLAAGGVHPKTAQSLAQHSTITLTMDRYSHVYRGELGKALNVLPNLSVPTRQTTVATGTDGKAAPNRLSHDLSSGGEVSHSSVQSGAFNAVAGEARREIEKLPEIEDFPPKNGEAGILVGLLRKFCLSRAVDTYASILPMLAATHGLPAIVTHSHPLSVVLSHWDKQFISTQASRGKRAALCFSIVTTRSCPGMGTRSMSGLSPESAAVRIRKR